MFFISCGSSPREQESPSNQAKVLDLKVSPAEKMVSAQKEVQKKETKLKLDTPKNDQIYFGAYTSFGDDENNVTKTNIEAFEKNAKKEISWVYFSNSWQDGITYPRETIQNIHKLGKVPFVRFLPRRSEEEDKANKTMITQDIIDGKFDKALIKWAQEAKEENIPILMDFGLEMTGFWMSWCGKWQGAGETTQYGDPSYPDGPERFRDAYRHIIDIFRAQGTQNITWFFHPDIQRMPDKEWNSAKYYYPGDDYIDWIGVSIYGAQFNNEKWKTFSNSLEEQYQWIEEISSTKPLAVLEIGVADKRKDGDKATWYKDTFTNILAHSYLNFSAFVYWDERWENEDGSITNLKIDSSKEALKAFQEGISDSRFVSTTHFK